jgi:uncharacterized membrane-anchored protein YitT (DUF2179 family)
VKRKIVDFLFNAKYRFDLGLQLLVFINFSMMCATTLKVFGIRGWFVLPLIVLAFLLVWLMGYVLDKYIRMQRKTEQQSMERSYAWELHRENIENVKEILSILKNKVKESS